MDEARNRSPDLVRIRCALVSVFDKWHLEQMVAYLHETGVRIIASGGTAASIRRFGMPVDEVSDATGFPEILGGRVKTLHPRIHGGLLADRANEVHNADLAANSIPSIDLLIANLYPFEEVSRCGDLGTTIENIDIGGPAMIRAAAKNHSFVCAVSDPEDYQPLVDELTRNDGRTTLEFRKDLATAAFGRTAAYDAAISSWMAKIAGQASPMHRTLAVQFRKALRYGENPHQGASLYSEAGPAVAMVGACQMQGPEPGLNNIADADAAMDLAAEFAPPSGFACVIVKHGNPCGVALGDSQLDAYRRALACDPLSAFGGIVAFNRCLEAAAAEALTETFIEAAVAPGVEKGVTEIMAAKPGVRLFACELPSSTSSGLSFRQVRGGMLIQDRDVGQVDVRQLRVVTKRPPEQKEIADMAFAWKVAKHTKSNAVVYARNCATVGIGAGQSSRVDAAHVAHFKMARTAEAQSPDFRSAPLAAASDAFFPFADGLEEAARAGATAVIQPGGSRNDAEVIEAADKLGVAMVFAGIRHFRH